MTIDRVLELIEAVGIARRVNIRSALDAIAGSRQNRAPCRSAAERARWGWLIGHVFRADVEHCARCGGPMRWVEAATGAEAISRLLAKHGMAPRPPPPSRTPPSSDGQLSFAFARSSR